MRKWYRTQERNPFVKRVIMRASLCLPDEGLMGWWLLRPTITILAIQQKFFNSRLFSRPSVKIWQFLRLRAKCLAVLRRSVNLIENYFVCIKKPRGNWSLVKISIDDNRSKGFFFTLNHFRFRFVSWNFFIYPFILYLLQSYGFNVSSYRLHCT